MSYLKLLSAGSLISLLIIAMGDNDKIKEIKRDLVINKNIPIEKVERFTTFSLKNINVRKTLNDVSRFRDSSEMALKHPEYPSAKISSIMTRLYR